MTNVPGKADHGGASTSFSTRVRGFVATARKAVVAFLATGVGVTFAQSLATFDFSNLTLGNLWAGLGSGLVSGLLTYVVRNEGTRLGLSPELLDAISRIVAQRVNAATGSLTAHVTEQVGSVTGRLAEAIKPRRPVRGPGGKFQPAPQDPLV